MLNSTSLLMELPIQRGGGDSSAGAKVFVYSYSEVSFNAQYVILMNLITMKLFHLAHPVCILPRVLAPALTKSRARALRAGSERVASFFGRRESSRHRNRFAALSGSTAPYPHSRFASPPLSSHTAGRAGGPLSYRVQRPFQPRNKRVESNVHLSEHLEFRSNCCPMINRSIFV